jgi:lysophospholipase L1-like esterase
MPGTLSRPRPPRCNICSGLQTPPMTRGPVHHYHNSPRLSRILQRVEYSSTNQSYLCPSCQNTHPARPSYGLNICVSTSQLHNFQQPRTPGVVCTPDYIHVDWVTIPGAVLSDLMQAWTIDYKRERTPMRVLVVAGLNDLNKGGDRFTVMAALRQFKEVVEKNNQYHPGTPNHFAVAPLLMPPKLVWYEDNPAPGPPPGYRNRVTDMQLLNQEISEFNSNNGVGNIPHINLMGARRYKKWYEDGSWSQVIHHRMGQWRSTEDRFDKLHLNDAMRIRMARMILDYFVGEVEREKWGHH